MRKITLPAARPALLAPRYLREWMGVEPTRADSTPLNGFEDRGPHRESTTPIDNEPMNQLPILNVWLIGSLAIGSL